MEEILNEFFWEPIINNWIKYWYDKQSSYRKFKVFKIIDEDWWIKSLITYKQKVIKMVDFDFINWCPSMYITRWLNMLQKERKL